MKGEEAIAKTSNCSYCIWVIREVIFNGFITGLVPNDTCNYQKKNKNEINSTIIFKLETFCNHFIYIPLSMYKWFIHFHKTDLIAHTHKTQRPTHITDISEHYKCNSVSLHCQRVLPVFQGNNKVRERVGWTTRERENLSIFRFFLIMTTCMYTDIT